MKAEFKTLKFAGNGGSTAAMRTTAEKILRVVEKSDIPGLWLVATQFSDSGFTITVGRKKKLGGADIRLAVDVVDRSEFTIVPDDTAKSAVIYTNPANPETYELSPVIRNILIDQGFGARRIESDVDVARLFERFGGRMRMDSDGNLVRDEF